MGEDATAVFVVFIGDPIHVTQAAVHSGTLAVALLCYLIGLSILCRRVLLGIKNWLLRIFTAPGISLSKYFSKG